MRYLASEQSPQIDRPHRDDGRREILRWALPAPADKACLARYGRHCCFEIRNFDPGNLIWIDANEKTLFERASRAANRPLLEGDNPREAFAQMLQARLPLYAKIAHLRVDTSVLTDEEVAVAILSKLRRLDRNPGLGLSIPATAQ